MHAWARRGRVAAAVGVATGMVLLPGTALAAPSAGNELGIGKQGAISAGGAAVSIPFAVSCPEGWRGSMWVNLVQANGSGFASGGNGKQVECTGSAVMGVLYLQASVYENTKPFKKGPASIVASMDAYDPAQICEYEPCAAPPVEGEPMPAEPADEAEAAPSAAKAPKASAAKPAASSSMSSSPKMPAPDTSNVHSEFSGTITLR